MESSRYNAFRPHQATEANFVLLAKDILKWNKPPLTVTMYVSQCCNTILINQKYYSTVNQYISFDIIMLLLQISKKRHIVNTIQVNLTKC